MYGTSVISQNVSLRPPVNGKLLVGDGAKYFSAVTINNESI